LTPTVPDKQKFTGEKLHKRGEKKDSRGCVMRTPKKGPTDLQGIMMPVGTVRKKGRELRGKGIGKNVERNRVKVGREGARKKRKLPLHSR